MVSEQSALLFVLMLLVYLHISPCEDYLDRTIHRIRGPKYVKITISISY